MAYQTPLTIKEVIDSIHKKDYLLPAIQREFVWPTEKIVKLFDSLMRDYPVGSFLFWKVEKEKSKNFQFYEFIRNYHEKNNKHNPKANISGNEDLTAILDGQQRLTALYIGIKGSFAEKLPYKRYDNPSAFPEKQLYLNLLSKPDDPDLEYDFQFLTKEESKNNSDKTFWFKVAEILDLEKEVQVNNYLIKNNLMSKGEEKSIFANETLFLLHSVIHKNPVINYYLEKGKKLDKVLNIFIRVNSGGTPLSYSDLLLSIATAQWETKDAREEITGFVDNINQVGNDFNFDKDFVLKSCLVLNDFPDIAFKVDNFNRDNMLIIEKNWNDIESSIHLAVELVSGFGYNRDTLTSNNALIPIAYYLKKIGVPNQFVQSAKYSDDRNSIKKWLICSLLKRTFGGQADNVYRPIRQVIKESKDTFPLKALVDKFKGSIKSLDFTDDEIQNLFGYQYGQPYTFSTLALLYPTLDFRNKFHIDHIFPKSFFTGIRLETKGIPEKSINFYMDNYNCLSNLQLLEGVPNQEKSSMDFEEWVNKIFKNKAERAEYIKKHFIPDVDLCFGNFEQFIKARTELIREQYQSILKIFD